MTRKAVLCILDGFGFGSQDAFNAFHIAKTPNFDKIRKVFPISSLKSSGSAVGLPEGQMGNSEVGHIGIGSGRVVRQTLPLINHLVINDNLLDHNTVEKIEAMHTVHIVGMLSDGGVHSHSEHILYLINKMKEINTKITIVLHIITDGRDVAPNHSSNYISNFLDKIGNVSHLVIATIAGRFYAMDRDERKDRTDAYYNLIQNGIGASDNLGIDRGTTYREKIKQIINNNHDTGIFDENLPCYLIDSNYRGIKDGDGIFFANFRADRMRQICQLFVDKNHNNQLFTMIDYFNGIDGYKDKIINIIPNVSCENTIADVLERNNLSQLRVAETEKYAHITFFFNGGATKKYHKYKEVLIPSKKVKSYDEVPQMSAYEVFDVVSKGIEDGEDFIAVNFANCDMVGHTGNFSAAVKATEVIDEIVGLLVEKAISKNYLLFITADHGNIEEMFDYENQLPHTQHTTTDVPFIFISNDCSNIKLSNGGICDIAPTVLSAMNLEIPQEMTGVNLIIRN